MSQRYQIRVTKCFERDFRRLPSETQERLRAALETLADNYRGLRRLRVGDYRAIYRVDETGEGKIVRLLFVAHRKRACQ